MRQFLLAICSFLFITMTASATVVHLHSPGNVLQLTFRAEPNMAIQYSLDRGNTPVILNSNLGIKIKDKAPLGMNCSVLKVDSSEVNTSWNPVWGEVKTIYDHHKELRITCRQNENAVIFVLVFRLFDDGLGFRYEFPEQPELKYFILSDELTQFHMTGDHKVFWIPGDYDTNEYSYTESRISEIDATVSNSFNEIATRSLIGPNYVQTPLMMKSANGLYINIHEAALVNYPAMQLQVDKANFMFTSQLVPDAVGNKAYLKAPCKTPWRTIVVSDKATDILASKIILNLNEPSAIANTDWIKPMKFVGVWWEMHVGVASWNYSNAKTIDLSTTDWYKLPPNGIHGANTERVKYYIDFAAANGIDAVLVEGWNVGWEDWFGNWKENVFDFVTPYPDFNVEELKNYAAQKKVQLIMHHETSASVTNYERRLPEAIAFMKANNYHAVKTGYVGRIIPRGEYHDGQWMVNHYIYVARQMAKNYIMVDAHEPVRPTGLHRTYPNWLACEAARGNEFNAWSKGNPPAHETILPFTRLMGGPMDYTPGIFQIQMNYYDSTKTNQVHTTLCKQLALYVTMYSPLQMAADLPENYLKHMDAFQFIKDVAVDWDDTKYLQAEPGDMLVIARKAKGSNNWFMGGITDENARVANVRTDFLDPDTTYVATIYSDTRDASWNDNPMAYQINKFLITNGTDLKLFMAPGGGFAISIVPATAEEINTIEKYK